MNPVVYIAGTDTDAGKTVIAAALASALDAHYWKPVQAGTGGGGDSAEVVRLGVPADRIRPEAYRLKTPASPHFAAECDGLEIDPSLTLPRINAPLVVEGAGGLMVPLSRKFLQIDLIARWRVPVVLVAATRLGTINHSLLSIEALKRRGIPILGVAFNGSVQTEAQRDALATICEFGGVKRLGVLPHLDALTPATLRAAFEDNFSVGNILGLGEGGP